MKTVESFEKHSIPGSIPQRALQAAFHNVILNKILIKLNTQKSGLFLKKSNCTKKMIPKNEGIAKKGTQNNGTSPYQAMYVSYHLRFCSISCSVTV